MYQVDADCRRLLWVGEERKIETLESFFTWFGKERAARLQVDCSDMWQAYLNVIRKRAGQALHVLDRFHVAGKLGEMIDKVRAAEARELKKQGQEPLKRSRWLLLKRPDNLTEDQQPKLAYLLKLNLRTVRAYLLKEDFQQFWECRSPTAANRFLRRWCRQAGRSRLKPTLKVARMLRKHRPLLLNWFRYGSAYPSGTAGSLNVWPVRPLGQRTGPYAAFKLASHATLGNAPQRDPVHRPC